jgi:hypothetical protein
VGASADDDLAQAILAKRSRSGSRDALGAFASKYGVDLPEEEDPLGDDAAFQAAQARLMATKTKKAKK